MKAAQSRYFVRAGEVPGYHPANHVGTVNRRIIGRDTVGAQKLEVVLGEIQKGKGALPHALKVELTKEDRANLEDFMKTLPQEAEANQQPM